METPYPRFFALDVLPPLKPSLVEWKLAFKDEKGNKLSPLKPSLVEWKHVESPPRYPARRTLKPSLVEWKLLHHRDLLRRVQPLKPSLVEWKLLPKNREALMTAALETFLSGMETCVSRTQSITTGIP